MEVSTKLKEIIEENNKMCQDFDSKLCIYGNGEDEYNKDKCREFIIIKSNYINSLVNDILPAFYVFESKISRSMPINYTFKENRNLFAELRYNINGDFAWTTDTISLIISESLPFYNKTISYHLYKIGKLYKNDGTIDNYDANMIDTSLVNEIVLNEILSAAISSISYNLKIFMENPEVFYG